MLQPYRNGTPASVTFCVRYVLGHHVPLTRKHVAPDAEKAVEQIESGDYRSKDEKNGQ